MAYNSSGIQDTAFSDFTQAFELGKKPDGQGIDRNLLYQITLAKAVQAFGKPAPELYRQHQIRSPIRSPISSPASALFPAQILAQ